VEKKRQAHGKKKSKSGEYPIRQAVFVRTAAPRSKKSEEQQSQTDVQPQQAPQTTQFEKSPSVEIAIQDETNFFFGGLGSTQDETPQRTADLKTSENQMELTPDNMRTPRTPHITEQLTQFTPASTPMPAKRPKTEKDPFNSSSASKFSNV
jgi:hypothetical protein